MKILDVKKYNGFTQRHLPTLLRLKNETPDTRWFPALTEDLRDTGPEKTLTTLSNQTSSRSKIMERWRIRWDHQPLHFLY